MKRYFLFVTLSSLTLTLTMALTHQQISSFTDKEIQPLISSFAANAMRRNPRTVPVPAILQNLAVDRMLKDKGFVRSVINCVLDKGPCDGHGRHMKRLAPEILRGHCPGCTRSIHNQVRRVISHIQRNFPNEWHEVMNRFLRNPAAHLQTSFFG